MVNVTKDNFLEKSDELCSELKKAKFVAIDLEMTGIRDSTIGDKTKPNRCDTPEERYEKIRSVPERYAIIQIGLSLFLEPPHEKTNEKEDGKNDEKKENSNSDHPNLAAKNYNFYVFPPSHKRRNNKNIFTKDLVMSPSSMLFLAQHDMDFNCWISKGIPYVTVDEESWYLEQFHQRHNNQQKPKTPGTVKKVEPKSPGDIAFVARAMARLREWIDSATPNVVELENQDHRENNHNEGEEQAVEDFRNLNHSLVFPPCNSFLRKCLYDAIEFEYPSLLVEKEEGRDSVLRVWRLNAKDRESRLQYRKQSHWERIQLQTIGWTRIFRALSEMNSNGTPIICHNGLMDLLFLFTHFHSAQLPQSYSEMKSIIHTYFPKIFDTKVMATEYHIHQHYYNTNNNNQQNNDDNNNNNANDNSSALDYSTTLPDLFHNYCENDADDDDTVHQSNATNAIDLIFPIRILNPDTSCPTNNDNSNETHTLRLHEAAYDAYMTGCVFYALSQRYKSLSSFDDTSKSSQQDTKHFFFLTCDHVIQRTLLGINKIHLSQTLYTIDLEANGEQKVEWDGHPQDPLNQCMSYSTIYCVKGINTSVNTRDIERPLKNISDENEMTVAFEIVWMDDSTFFVATRCPPKRRDLLPTHGQLILSVLKRRFPQQSICTLQEFLSQKEKLKESQRLQEESSSSSKNMQSIPPSDTNPTKNITSSSFLGRVWGYFAQSEDSNKKRDFYKLYTIDNVAGQSSGGDGPNNKRQRTD